MNVKQLLGDYESEKTKQKEDWEKKKAEENNRRHLNAEKVESHLREIVLPVLNLACNDITESGYPCAIETVSIKDGSNTQSQKTFALRLILKTDKEKGRDSHMGYSMEFNGDFESLTVTIKFRLQTSSDPKPSNALLNSLTKEFTEQKVEEFLKLVFKA